MTANIETPKNSKMIERSMGGIPFWVQFFGLKKKSNCFAPKPTCHEFL
jgi:hypothetical protein